MTINSTILGKSITTRISVNNFKNPEFKLDFDAKQIKTKLPLDLKQSYELKLDHLTGDMDALLSKKNKLTINSSTLKSKSFTLKTTGSAILSSPSPKYDLNLSARPFLLSQLNTVFPKLPVKKAKGTGQFNISFDNAKDKINFKRVFINTKKAGFTYKKIKFSNLNITALISDKIRKNRFTMKKGSFFLTKNTITDLNVKSYMNSKLMTISFDGKWNTHKTKGLLKISNPLTQKKSMDLTAYSANLNATKLKNLALEIKYALPPKEKSFYSKIKWVRNVKNAIPKGFSLITGNIKADTVSHEYFKSKDFYLSAKLKNFSGNVEEIQGEISIKSGAGTFFKVQEKSEKDRIYNIVALPILMMFKMNRMSALKLGSTLKNVNFYSVGGDYSFDS
ncbi:MAG: hypothetical protein KAI33_07100, partial [Elusimicrobiales bacterium]|nr:hypothetical protein [Elusimicrobiales bacterium]